MINLKKMQLTAVAALLGFGAVGAYAGEAHKNAGSDQLLNQKTDSSYENKSADKSAVVPAGESDTYSSESDAYSSSEPVMDRSEAVEQEVSQSEGPVDESEAMLPDRWSSSDQHEFTEEPQFEEEPRVSAADQ